MLITMVSNRMRPFKVGDSVHVYDREPDSRGWWKGTITQFSDDNLSVKVDFKLAKKWNTVRLIFFNAIAILCFFDYIQPR